jgi:thiamine-phosphate pyrophosphorylase
MGVAESGGRIRIRDMRSVFRILDANFNRAREALRVLEDLARFHHDDASLAASLKEARHSLDREARPHFRAFVEARNSISDVGRNGDLAVGAVRPLFEVAQANFKRAEEALRAIEEVSKGRFGRLSGAAHRLRYSLYSVEKGFHDPRRRLAAARLYVLLDPSVTRRSLAAVAREAARGGAEVLQLRQKPRVDLGLAKEIRAAVPDVLFLVNDDLAVALASGADGVHLGLEDLPIPEARRLGAGIVGATSHSLAEARRAVRAGADYISVGPMFPTPLKPHLRPEGRTYLAGAKRLGVPWFCIGGITQGNVEPSFGRVAVCAAVTSARHPESAARAIRRGLEAISSGT